MKKRPRTIRAYVDEMLCTGCGICADRCVRNAITIGGTAIIDTNICTGCGKCVDACPAGALVLR
ncbi:MAG TPA: 4Fe-4S binding protein [Spirochaetota bacterium]|nr:4Fe-4S binding protein [Spirochaetota bacterium]HPO46409.1 4Fe-4S binding protein [Spirochaetota bacterium]